LQSRIGKPGKAVSLFPQAGVNGYFTYDWEGNGILQNGFNPQALLEIVVKIPPSKIRFKSFN